MARAWRQFLMGYGSWTVRKKWAPVRTGFVKDIEFPAATLVLSGNQLIGGTRLVADCKIFDLPALVPVALNRKFPPLMAGTPSVIGPPAAACTVIVTELVADASP